MPAMRIVPGRYSILVVDHIILAALGGWRAMNLQRIRSGTQQPFQTHSEPRVARHSSSSSSLELEATSIYAIAAVAIETRKVQST